MTQLDTTRPPQAPIVHGRRSSGPPTWRVPRQAWPIVAMIAMIPILIVLLLALFV